jgi:hypothetical protein
MSSSTSTNDAEDKDWNDLFPLKPTGPVVNGRLRHVEYAVKTSDHDSPKGFKITNGPERQRWGCTGPIYYRNDDDDDDDDDDNPRSSSRYKHAQSVGSSSQG